MEDKRIVKTKQNIKKTLLVLLEEMPFEKVTVAELCRQGMISRITFYTYYEDKYALADEMLEEYVQDTRSAYRRLQQENNPRKVVINGYHNLMEAILKIYFENFAFFSKVTAEDNPYLFSVFSRRVFCSIVDYMEQNPGLRPCYPVREAAALICSGLFGAISMSIADHIPENEIWEMTRNMYVDMLDSRLFRSGV